ncbi:hypothetical protein BHM03_00015870 [Ensete ventricosum]|nr:hypothetical protein BHM03_00015870 [Ensete ventricosum]
MASDYLRPPGRKKVRDHTPPAHSGRSTMVEKGGGGIEGGGGGERWKAAIVNLSEMGTNVESLQKILVKKAVFADEETFAKASLTSEQARTIKVSAIQKVGFGNDMANIDLARTTGPPTKHDALLAARTTDGMVNYNGMALEQRVEALERELDAAIAAAARARTEKRQAEAAQRAAELCAKDLSRELENTTKVFKLHMEELRFQKEEISKKQSEIKVLEATVLTLSRNDTSAED